MPSSVQGGHGRRPPDRGAEAPAAARQSTICPNLMVIGRFGQSKQSGSRNHFRAEFALRRPALPLFEGTHFDPATGWRRRRASDRGSAPGAFAPRVTGNIDTTRPRCCQMSSAGVGNWHHGGPQAAYFTTRCRASAPCDRPPQSNEISYPTNPIPSIADCRLDGRAD